MSITDSHFINKTQFGMVQDVKFFNFPDSQTPDSLDSSKSILDKIESYLQSKGDEVAAIVFEPIQGAAGFVIPPDGFLNAIVKIARKHNIVSICDEIQTGVCRTGSFYYINQIKLDPDIVLLGKSLAGGYYPLSAVIAKREFFEAVDIAKSGFDSTFANNLLAMEIANGVIDYIQSENISKKVVKTGKTFLGELKKTEKFSFIKEVKGIGMAFSFKVNAPSNKTIDNARLAKLIKKEAFANHLIIQTAGINWDRMKMAPSFLVTDKEIQMIFKKFNVILENIEHIINTAA